jgi:hypothetical protein
MFSIVPAVLVGGLLGATGYFVYDRRRRVQASNKARAQQADNVEQGQNVNAEQVPPQVELVVQDNTEQVATANSSLDFLPGQPDTTI